MATIPQKPLFSWKETENLGDLKRLQHVLEALPDEPLMQKLEAERGNGRNDYPIRAMWNSIIASYVFQHDSIEALRRELLRNDRLRCICGFDSIKEAKDAVGDPSNYSRFLQSVERHPEELEAIMDSLVGNLFLELPGFGRYLATDSKQIESHGNPKSKKKLKELIKKGPDGRRDLDADWGKKTYECEKKDGTLETKTVKWFGYKLHLVVDAVYELPIGYEVTKASRPDNIVGGRLIENWASGHPQMVSRCEALTGDKAYDDKKIIQQLWEGNNPDSPRGILPIIPKRNDWKDDSKYDDRSLFEGVDNITYDCQGQIYCYDRKRKRRKMVYDGYEPGRDCQKWRCPVAVYAHLPECCSYGRCSKNSDYGRVVRVKRDFDPRTFLPIARRSLKFDRIYNKRTSVERVFSRMDVNYGFEDHYIRGQRKMHFRCGFALVVMLAMALGRTRENKKKEGRKAEQEDRQLPSIRSLVRAA